MSPVQTPTELPIMTEHFMRHVNRSQAPYVSLNAARRLALFKQGLHQRPPFSGRETILDCIRRIRLLQLDSINVVARSHQLVILSRIGQYNSEDVYTLLHDRALFEQWAHAECLLPMEDYPYFEPLILARRQEPMRYRVRKLLGNRTKKVFRMVMEAIEKQGSLSSRNFNDFSSYRRTWWNRKPAKLALDGLFYQGFLMIDRRVNFECYYDLPKRILPPRNKNSAVTPADASKWITTRSIQCLGVATFPQIRDYYRQYARPIREALTELINEKLVLPVVVEGWSQPAYVDAEDIPLLQEIEDRKYEPRITTFLSPFDNLIWDRQRLRSLFAFDYRVEFYQPATNPRRFGYYVMPILHNGALVGRMDPKLVREQHALVIHSIHLEQPKSVTPELVGAIGSALDEFAAFHQADTIIIEHTYPALLKRALRARDRSRIKS